MVTRRGGGRRGRPDARQLPIAWAAPAAGPAAAPATTAAAEPTTAHVADEARAINPAAAAEGPKPDAVASPIVERLPWDFATTFPPPLPDAIDAGVIDAADADGENLSALHADYAGQMAAALREADRAADAARAGKGVAATAKPGPGRRPWFDVLAETYAAAFGGDAAAAFARAVRARHAGIEVVADGRHRNRVEASSPAVAAGPTPAITVEATTPRVAGRVRKRARPRRSVEDDAYIDADDGVPVPRPLPAAVAAGKFGYDEHGRPVDPGPDEVWAISEAQAERLAGLLGDRDAAHRRRKMMEFARLDGQLRAATADYAEDFGDAAAERLLAFARRRFEAEAGRTGGGRGR